jgi:hypothetical protein
MSISVSEVNLVNTVNAVNAVNAVKKCRHLKQLVTVSIQAYLCIKSLWAFGQLPRGE